MEKILNINGVQIRCRASQESEPNSCEFLERGDCLICNCNLCDHGVIHRRDENGIIYSHPCQCRDRAVIRKRLRRAGLDQLAEKCTLVNFQAEAQWQNEVKALAERYVAEKAWRDGKGFFLAGQSGSGKTHVAVGIASAATEAGAKPQYLRWNAEATRIKSLITDPEAYRDAIYPYISENLLLIDDLWKVAPTQADLRLAFELLDLRLADRKPTIVTSEWTLGEISGMLDGAGEAVAGRIFEQATPYVLEISRIKDRNYRWRSRNR